MADQVTNAAGVSSQLPQKLQQTSECDAEHGLVGTATNDDFSLRVSQAADGDDTIAQVLEFARALSQASVSGNN